MLLFYNFNVHKTQEELIQNFFNAALPAVKSAMIQSRLPCTMIHSPYVQLFNNIYQKTAFLKGDQCQGHGHVIDIIHTVAVTECNATEELIAVGLSTTPWQGPSNVTGSQTGPSTLLYLHRSHQLTRLINTVDMICVSIAFTLTRWSTVANVSLRSIDQKSVLSSDNPIFYVEFFHVSTEYHVTTDLSFQAYFELQIPSNCCFSFLAFT